MTNKTSSYHIEGINPAVIRKWISGIPYEIAFWRSYYGNKRRLRDLMSWSQLNKECIIDCFDIAKYISSIDHPAKIADLGCALSYAFGNIINNEHQNVIYIDPLAPFYNKILSRKAPDFPRITFGMGECLTLFLPQNSFDFIHIRNSLDHGAYPMLTLWQSLAVTRPGGVVYLNHKPDEAEHEGYRGFHQFNITLKDNKLILWNRSESINVSDILSEYADIETHKTPQGHIVAIIRKKNITELPPEIIEKGRNYADIAMQELLACNHSAARSISYQRSFLFSAVAHKTMRLLPYSWINTLKRILAKS